MALYSCQKNAQNNGTGACGSVGGVSDDTGCGCGGNVGSATDGGCGSVSGASENGCGCVNSVERCAKSELLLFAALILLLIVFLA